MTLTFAALDVETANSRRGSVCSLGVVVVDAGDIVSRHHWLCRPPEGMQQFDSFNSRLHGIVPDDVADQPSFCDRLQEVLRAIGDRPVSLTTRRSTSGPSVQAATPREPTGRR